MRKTILLLVMAALTLLAASHSFAGITPADTKITNIATVNYTDDNGNTGFAESLEVVTTVNTVHSVLVTSLETAKTGENKAFVVYSFDVVNTGNVDETFNLQAVTQAILGNWIPTSVNIYADTGTPGWDGESTDISTTTLLASEDVFPVLVVAEVPANSELLNSEDQAQHAFTFTASSAFATDSVTDITTTIEAPLLTHTLTVDNASPVPGQTVTFIATITSTGTLAPGNVDFTATVPGGFTILSAPSITTGGGSIGAAGPAITGSNATLTDELGSNLTWVITWSATVDATTSGSVTPTADATSTIVGDSITKTGTSSTINIVDVYTVTISTPADIVITPGDDVVFGDDATFDMTVTNTGNNPRTFALSYTGSDKMGPYAFYSDPGMALADRITDTGSLVAGASTKIYIGVAGDATHAYNDDDTLTVTATATSVPTESATTASFAVNVQAPFLTIEKKVNGVDANTANPGETLTYTITIINIGDAVANNVFIADAVPTYTTYVASSLSGTVVGSGVVDNDDTADGDTVLLDALLNIYAGNNGTNGDTAFSLAAGSSYILSFDVQVD